MTEDKVLYFEQSDNLSGKAIYRMHIAEASADRLVFDVENVSTMRYLLVTLLHPGEMQSIYFIDRESENVWRYYSIMRTAKNANRLIAGNESAAVNRAVAFYRHIVGIPTGQEPPAARRDTPIVTSWIDDLGASKEFKEAPADRSVRKS
jgi:hypothetical protein